ncbi:MAG: protein kinase, partial [Fimbriimonadales bacterium]
MSAQIVLGHYQIIREIARSNDIVYEARDTRINRIVAIKELNMPAGATDAVRQDRVARFQREARAAGSLTHPNIVTIFEAEEDNGRYFIVMEYLEGETLRQRIDREGTIPPEEACQITMQILDGLAHAHAKGIVHRDIKPENIHLLPGGLVKITDFGIARIKHEPNITMDGQIFGTPSYMAPEQVQGGEVDERTDLFAVGVVLYEMVSGMKPFTGDSVITISYNIVNTDPVVPANMPPAILLVVRQALRKAPSQRFQSASEMKQAIQHALNQLKAPPDPVFPMNPWGVPTSSGSTAPPWALPHPSPVGGTPQPTASPVPSGASAPVPPLNPSAPPPFALPAPPPPPLISRRLSQLINQVLMVMLIGGAIVGVLAVGGIAAHRAYKEYQLQQEDERATLQARRAEELYAKGRYYESAQIYYQLLNNPKLSKWREGFKRNLAAALSMHGNQLLQNGRYAEAVEAYQESLRYHPLPEAYAG